MDLNVIEELKEKLNIIEAKKKNMVYPGAQLTNKENQIKKLNKELKNIKEERGDYWTNKRRSKKLRKGK